MQRLVYAPKVFAWVKREGDPEPFNLTPYITGGSVTRRINQVSSAELTLRNPKRKFTKRTKEGHPFFRPMDPITIWMSRLRNHPVQVFTGYIDRSPYIQLHPGVVNIMASCTLKRLLHTYWDPALPYVEEFMREYNWIVNRQTGTLSNRLNTSQDLIDQQSEEDDEDRQSWIEKYQPWNKPDANEKQFDKLELTDGSVGKLLYATMKHVGNWDKNTIKIEKLPPDLITHVTNIYYAFHEDSEAAKKEVEHYLKKLIGEGDYSGGGIAGIGLGSGGRTGEVVGIDNITKTIVGIAERYGIPPELPMTVTSIETGYGQNMHREGADYWGWFQIDIGGSRYKNNGPYKKEDLLDLGWSCNAFCETAVRDAPQGSSLRNNLSAWAMRVQGVDCGNNPLFCGSSWTTHLNRAKGYLRQHANSDDD